MTIYSMTGFASGQGVFETHSWSWELRSVNAKGLDLRLRVPDWLEGLETHLRSRLGKSLARGNVSLSLRLARQDEGAGCVQLNKPLLASVLEALAETEALAQSKGIDLSVTSAADLLSVRGVLEQSQSQDDPEPIVNELKKEFETILSEFVQMRETEGQALTKVLSGQLLDIRRLTEEAAKSAEARKPLIEENLKSNLSRVLDNAEGVAPERIAQELAMLAVKADVTEEIDRLAAHVVAAEDLLQKGGAIGRKLDFLMQEFNREANTLCSKAQNSHLTAIGLELKTLIDQMREQVQNIE